MKQLLILSGKGGTGKTTLAGAFIKLADARAFADCDVDAPNLHLTVHLTSDPQRSDFYGLDKAVLDLEKCTGCGVCRDNCRFDAITKRDDKYSVDPYSCEGCSLCEVLCPARAIFMEPHVSGELMLHKNHKVFSTAQLKMGSGNSGKLVTEVKKRLQKETDNVDLAVIDGSPGIGCPVIASLSGVDMVLIVAEPSLSGISDMKRIITTAGIFHMKIAVCVNKYDTNPENTKKIEDLCREEKIPFTGRIPFDREAVRAVNTGRTVVELDCAAGKAVREVFDNTMQLLYEMNG